MADKIEIRDPQLKALVDRAMADLEGFYPDKAVVSLNDRHKGLSNRIGELWKRVGYPSCEAFLAAYGFTVVTRPSSGGRSGGRPPVVDPEKLMAELAKRYEGREKPGSLGDLIQENPDLKGPIKTVQNKAPEVFGRTLAKELICRGLLNREANTPGAVSDAGLQAMLDALAEKYADAAARPSSIEQLKAENPEYAAEFAALVARARSLYNTTPKKKLIELGIISSKAGGPTLEGADQLKAVIDELGEKLCDIPNAEKPQTVDELTQRLPDLGALIASGAKQKLVTKKNLQDLGILAPSATAIRTVGIRRIKFPELVGEYTRAGLQILIEPKDGGASLLPTGICGIDVEAMTELRHALVMFKIPGTLNVSVGDSFQLGVETFKDNYLNELHRFCITTGTTTLTTRIGVHNSLSDHYLAKSKSPLLQYVGAKAVKVSQRGDVRVAQVELTWLADLQRDTLVGVMHASGIVREPDLRGGFGWYFRIWQIENGLRSLGELKEGTGQQPEPEAAAKKEKTAKSAANGKASPAKKPAAESEKEERGEKASASSKKTPVKKPAETADEGTVAKKAPARTSKSTPASKTEKSDATDGSKGKPAKSPVADAGKDKPKAAKKKEAKPVDSSAGNVVQAGPVVDAAASKKTDRAAAEAVEQPAESAPKPAPAKKTLGQVLAQIHASVEREIAKGAPGISGAEVMRKTRAAMVSAGGDGSMFDATIRELERKEAGGNLPPRPLGEGDLAQDKPLRRVVELLRAEGGGLSRGTVVNKLGHDAVKSAAADNAIVENDGKLYLWCQHDKQGRPMRDFKPVIDSLQERLDAARKEAAAWTPADETRLSEVATAHIEAQRQLNNAGFFQFGKKKELRARIEELGRERSALEEARLKAMQAQKELDALQDELEQAKAEAKKMLEEHGLL